MRNINVMKKLVLISVILLAFFSSCSPGKKVVVSSSSDPVEKEMCIRDRCETEGVANHDIEVQRV